jgi:hypothetical protein
MPRPLADVIADQERVFAELLQAQRELHNLNRAGEQMGIIDGDTSAVDAVLEQVHASHHLLDALGAEALQAALTPPP